MVALHFVIYILSFGLLWMGAGLIITATSRFSQKLRLSPFAFSFIFLGILTSMPEFSVGIQAVINHDAQIFVGNLLGGILVLFLFVIPLLAVFGNGISLKHEMDHSLLIATLGVILAPSLFVLDKRVTNLEGVIMIALYSILVYAVERKNGIFDKKNQSLLNIKAYSYKDFLRIILGLGIVFVASHLIVDNTKFFAQLFGIPAFYVSLIVVALGTDLPELTLAVRSVLSGKKELAMGDYIGAAAASTLLFGIFTLLHNGEILTISNFSITLVFTLLALSAFYFFFRTKLFISRNNGLFLLSLYLLFVFFEFVRR